MKFKRVVIVSGLLQLFIFKVLTNYNVIFDDSPDETSFIDIIKKIISLNEANFQVCMVQCLCHLLSNLSLEKQIILLLEANIPGKNSTNILKSSVAYFIKNIFLKFRLKTLL